MRASSGDDQGRTGCGFFQETYAVKLATSAQHLGEAMQIADRRKAARGGELGAGRKDDIFYEGLYEGRGKGVEGDVLRAAHRAEPRCEILAYAEARVAHAERLEDLVTEHLGIAASPSVDPQAHGGDDRVRDEHRVADPLAGQTLGRQVAE